MTLKVNATLTYEEVTALYTLVSLLQTSTDEELSKKEKKQFVERAQQELDLCKKVTCGLKSELFKVWQALPEGNFLKFAYEDDVWTLDDTDLNY